MESTQDQYIHKKILYKADKKLDTIQQEYFRQLFPSPENPRKLSNQEFYEELNSLEFINFKYRTALLSSRTDLLKNEEELIAQESNVQTAKQQIKELQEKLQRALKAKENKQKYNEICSQIIKYDKKDVFDEKIGKMNTAIQELTQKYNNDMTVYNNRERLLMTSIAALKSFLNDFNNRGEAAPQPFRANVSDPNEEYGQIY